MSKSAPSTTSATMILRPIPRIIAVIAIGVVAVIFFLFVYAVRGQETVSRLLPANRTIGFLRILNTPDTQKDTLALLQKSKTSGSGVTASGTTIPIQPRQGISLPDMESFWRSQQHLPFNALTIAYLQGSSEVAIPALLLEFDTMQKQETFWSGIAVTKEKPSQPLTPARVSFPPLGSSVFAVRTDTTLILSASEDALGSIAETIRQPSTALARSEQYQGSSFWKGTVEGFIDPKKAVAALSALTSDNRIARDVMTLLDPLMKQTQGAHLAASLGDDGTYRFHLRISGSSSFFHPLQSSSGRAPPLPDDPDMMAAVSGTRLLGGWYRLANALGETQPDSRVVLQALARYLIATYVSPRLAPEQLLAANTGGYWMVATQDGDGNRSSYGSIELSSNVAPAERAEGWLRAFGSESRLMMQRNTRATTVDDRAVTEEYLSIPPFRAETIPVGTTLMHSLRIEGKHFSPSIAWRNTELLYATHAATLKKLIERKERNAEDIPAGEFVFFVDGSKAFPSLWIMGNIRLAAGIHLRDDGAQVRGTARLSPSR